MLAATAALCTSIGAPAQEPLTFGVEVDVVRLDVVVTRGGEPVRGLTAADFEVRDSGVRQDIRVVDPGRNQIAADATLVLDTSGSTAGPRLEKLRTASRAFLDGLLDIDAASLIAFSDEVHRVSDEEVGREAVELALEATTAGGTTALYDAIYLGLVLADPKDARPIVLVFTDGIDTVSWLDIERVRDVARETEAVVYVVLETRELLQRALGGESPLDDATRFLLDLAEDTGGRVWHAKSIDELRGQFLEVLDEVRTRYLILYEPQGVAREGWHELDVKLKGRKGKIRTRPGYQRSPTG